MTPIERHNKPLYDAMVAKGCRLHVDGKRGYFVDAKGDYVAYPPGYITGPGIEHNGSPTPLYVSVQGHNGWLQHSFKEHQQAEAVAWAIQQAEEVLKSPSAKRLA